MDQQDGFWAIVALFGHSEIAGFVGSQTVGGEAFLRVDVPATTKQEAWSRLYGKGAIYSISPMAEDLVRARAERMQVAPLTAWDLPAEMREKLTRKALAGPDDDQDDNDYDECPI